MFQTFSYYLAILPATTQHVTTTAQYIYIVVMLCCYYCYQIIDLYMIKELHTYINH